MFITAVLVFAVFCIEPKYGAHPEYVPECGNYFRGENPWSYGVPKKGYCFADMEDVVYSYKVECVGNMFSYQMYFDNNKCQGDAVQNASMYAHPGWLDYVFGDNDCSHAAGYSNCSYATYSFQAYQDTAEDAQCSSSNFVADLVGTAILNGCYNGYMMVCNADGIVSVLDYGYDFECTGRAILLYRS